MILTRARGLTMDLHHHPKECLKLNKTNRSCSILLLLQICLLLRYHLLLLIIISIRKTIVILAITTIHINIIINLSNNSYIILFRIKSRQ